MKGAFFAFCCWRTERSSSVLVLKYTLHNEGYSFSLSFFPLLSRLQLTWFHVRKGELFGRVKGKTNRSWVLTCNVNYSKAQLLVFCVWIYLLGSSYQWSLRTHKSSCLIITLKSISRWCWKSSPPFRRKNKFRYWFSSPFIFLFVQTEQKAMNESSVFTLLWHGKLYYTEKKARNSGKKKIISDYSSVLLREESRNTYISRRGYVFVWSTAGAIK